MSGSSSDELEEDDDIANAKAVDTLVGSETKLKTAAVGVCAHANMEPFRRVGSGQA